MKRKVEQASMKTPKNNDENVRFILKIRGIASVLSYDLYSTDFFKVAQKLLSDSKPYGCWVGEHLDYINLVEVYDMCIDDGDYVYEHNGLSGKLKFVLEKMIGYAENESNTPLEAYLKKYDVKVSDALDNMKNYIERGKKYTSDNTDTVIGGFNN